MKHTFTLLIVIGIFLSCSPAKKLPHEKTIENSSEISLENDGYSYEKAIVINEKNETAGIRAEYAWLAKNYPLKQVRSICRKGDKPGSQTNGSPA